MFPIVWQSGFKIRLYQLIVNLFTVLRPQLIDLIKEIKNYLRSVTMTKQDKVKEKHFKL